MGFNGFSKPNTTPTPNQFYDEVLAKVKPVSELKVILYVIRRTYGWGKFVDRISQSQFKDGINGLDNGTGLSGPSVTRGLQAAVEHGYLARYVVCRKCKNVVDDRVTVEKLMKPRQSTGAQVVEVDSAPATCPYCLAKLRGREHIYYSLNFNTEDSFDLLRNLGGSYHTFLDRVQKKFHSERGDDGQGSVQEQDKSGGEGVRGGAGEIAQPKIIEATGDKQVDATNLSAVANSVLSTVVIAKELQQAINPGSSWPEGKGRASRNSRSGMLAIVEQIEAEVGYGQHRTIVHAIQWMAQYVNGEVSPAPRKLDVGWLDRARNFAAWKAHIITHATAKPWETRVQPVQLGGLFDKVLARAKQLEPTETEKLWQTIDSSLAVSINSHTYQQYIVGATLERLNRTYRVVVDKGKVGWMRDRLTTMLTREIRSAVGDREAQVEIVSRDG